MKGLMIFAVMVLGYSMINMFQLKAGASTYKQGINAYMEHQATKANTVYNRSPAIVKNK